jgi:hypothetical protein
MNDTLQTQLTLTPERTSSHEVRLACQPDASYLLALTGRQVLLPHSPTFVDCQRFADARSRTSIIALSPASFCTPPTPSTNTFHTLRRLCPNQFTRSTPPCPFAAFAITATAATIPTARVRCLRPPAACKILPGRVYGQRRSFASCDISSLA